MRISEVSINKVKHFKAEIEALDAKRNFSFCKHPSNELYGSRVYMTITYDTKGLVRLVKANECKDLVSTDQGNKSQNRGG